MSVKARPNTCGDEAGEQPVAGAMAGAVGGLLAIDAAADHHVEPVVEQPRDHARATLGAS